MQPPRLRACSEICASFLPWPKPSSMTVAGTRRALPYGFDDADLPPKANNRDITARTRIVNIIHIVKYISRPSFRGFIRSGRRSWSRATKVPYRLGRPFRPLAANPESVVGVSAPRGSRGALPPAASLSREAPDPVSDSICSGRGVTLSMSLGQEVSCCVGLRQPSDHPEYSEKLRQSLERKGPAGIVPCGLFLLWFWGEDWFCLGAGVRLLAGA